MRVAVAGNPNSGKTTLFNAVTGANARVGNYPGVTVERREASATLESGTRALLIDLPGCYSLTARSPEEEIAHEVLMGRLGEPRPDVVVCVVDATNLARGLYLVHQLLELGLPLIVALNMIDVAREQGIEIDVDGLSQRLGTPIIATAARSGEGLGDLMTRVAAGDLTRAEPVPPEWLSLDPTQLEELQRLIPVLESTGNAASLGEALWWVSSELEELGTTEAPEALRAAIAHCRKQLDPEGDGSFNRRVIEARYARVDSILEGLLEHSTASEEDLGHRLDRVLLHPVGGMSVFVVTMFILFQAVFAWADPMITGVEWLMGALADGVGAVLPEGLLSSLLVNGVIAGIGNVLVFIPQIALLFLGLALLEESGYLARAAFLLDSVMRRVGLHGKSFIPLMSSFACAVPGVMAARTVESSRDRLVTMFIAPFMSCSARLPVYVLVIGAVFATTGDVFGVLSAGGLIMTAMYFLGFVAAVFTAWLLKRTVLKSPAPPFILELPPYKPPMMRAVIRQVYQRCRVFVTQTGTIILAISLLLWAMLTFPQEGLPPEELEARTAAITEQFTQPDARAAALEDLGREDQARQLETSVAGHIGHAIEPLIEPLGFDWRIGVGLVASFAAREVLVSTLGQVYALDAEIEADSPVLRDALLADVDPATGRPRFSPLTGLSLMVFFVLAMQCMSTVATVKRESNSWKWALAQLVYMNTLAYAASLAVYQTGVWLGYG